MLPHASPCISITVKSLLIVFVAGLEKKNDGYGKMIDTGVYMKQDFFRDHRN
jgi:hypothetical protein